MLNIIRGINMYIYDEKFYEISEDAREQDAEIVVPQIINWLKPKSIIDFGCGLGTWLSVVKQVDLNIEIYGLDGDYVNEKELKIDKRFFKAVDLSKPIQIKESYDLAMSLEVAEHIDEAASEIFIDNITGSSDNVLFSAAIPEQGGVHHVNEQWQEYWISKFEARGYSADVSVRNFFWHAQEITPWRRQNFIFFHRGEVRKSPIVETKEIYNIVHPEMYFKRIREAASVGAKDIYCMLDNAIKAAIKSEKEVVIYPFGQNGYVCKEILNHKYHIQEKAILDNVLCKTNQEIYGCEYLASMDEDYCVIDTCSKQSIHHEVLRELKKYVKDENIITVFRYM